MAAVIVVWKAELARLPVSASLVLLLLHHVSIHPRFD
jgi:hypothetical protein